MCSAPTTPAATSRAEWLAARRAGIGSSDAPAVLGVHPWASPWEVWAQKRGLLEESDETEAMEAGRILEPVVADWYAQKTGRPVVDEGATKIHRHPEHDFLLSTLDRTIPEADGKEGPGVLEVKTASLWKRDDWEDGAPLSYQVQVQHQLAVTGRKWAAIAVLIGGQHLRFLDVERNDRFIDALVEQEAAFWDLVQSGEAPPTDGHPVTREVLAKLYPQSNGESVSLPADLVDVAQELRRLKDERKRLEREIAARENAVKAAMGENEIGVLPDGSVFTHKTQTRKAYAVSETTYRVLRFKEPKE